MKQVIEHTITHQNDFDIQRYGLRLQGYRTDQTQRLPQGLNPNFTRPQAPLERIPRKRLLQ